VQNAFEVHPAADDERAHDGDEGQHDMQVTDDGKVQRGFMRIAHHIFGQEGFKTVSIERPRHSAKNRRNQGSERDHEEGNTLHIVTFFCLSVVFILQAVFVSPGPQRHQQQASRKENKRQTGDVDAVQHPVMPPISKGQPAKHHHQGADGNRGVDWQTVVVFHFQ